MNIAESPLLLRRRSVHLLIDPDRWSDSALISTLANTNVSTRVTSLIVGGTYIHTGNFASTVKTCKSSGKALGNFLTAGPVDSLLSPLADYVIVPLALGATDVRFITDHVIAAAPTIDRYSLSVVRVAYLQLDGGRATSAGFFTQSIPIPREKPEIVRTLALAGRMLGVEAVYLEAGSAAILPVTGDEVQAAIDGSHGLPVIVGGGIKTTATCETLFDAGASAIIVGSALEKGSDLSWLPVL
jgi:phosphoglycerol geranylgeranyltransferase